MNDGEKAFKRAIELLAILDEQGESEAYRYVLNVAKSDGELADNLYRLLESRSAGLPAGETPQQAKSFSPEVKESLLAATIFATLVAINIVVLACWESGWWLSAIVDSFFVGFVAYRVLQLRFKYWTSSSLLGLCTACLGAATLPNGFFLYIGEWYGGGGTGSGPADDSKVAVALVFACVLFGISSAVVRCTVENK